jgi:hypothetical protein
VEEAASLTRQHAATVRRNQRVTAYGCNTRHWQTTRLARLEHDGYRCQLQLGRCTGRATHVHLRPELHGDHRVATISDCVSVCASCSGSVDAPRSLRGAIASPRIASGNPRHLETPRGRRRHSQAR